MADLEAPAGTKKSHRKCIEFLAKTAGMWAENLYNKITPVEFIEKIGRRDLLDTYKTHYGKDRKWAKVPDSWHRWQANRDQALKEGKKWGEDWRLSIVELPEMPKSATRKSENK